MDFKGHLPYSTDFPVGKLRPEAGETLPKITQYRVPEPCLARMHVPPLQTWEGLPSSGPRSPATGLGREQKEQLFSSGEPLRQARRKTVSSLSTPEPAVTHRALTFRGQWEGTRRPCSHPPHCPTACRTLSAVPQLRVVQLLGWGAHPSPAASPGPSGKL